MRMFGWCKIVGVSFIAVMFEISAASRSSRPIASQTGWLQDLSTRFHNSYLGSECTETCKTSQSWNDSMLANGSWSDVDYNDQSRAKWLAIDHWYRLNAMAQSHQCKQCTSLGNSSSLLSTIHRGIAYWQVHDYQNPNWWFNDIGLPMSMMQTLLLLKPTGSLSTSELGYARTVLERAAWRKGGGTWVGENREWGLRIQANRGCIEDNETATIQAFDLLWADVVVSTDPAGGIQRSRAFHQHGELVQTGTYGAGFSGDLLALYELIEGIGPPVAPPDTVQQLLGSYVVAGQWPSMRTQILTNANTQRKATTGDSPTNTIIRWDMLARGREITRSTSAGLTLPTSWAGPLRTLAQAPSISSTIAGQLLAMAEAVDPTSSSSSSLPVPLTSGLARHFWDSDYTVAGTDAALLSYRAWSNRTYNAECVNSEGLRSWHKADGVLQALQWGDEFVAGGSVVPVLDWGSFPGTSEWRVPDEEECSKVKQRGATSFVGGLGDGDGVGGAMQAGAPQSYASGIAMAAYDHISGDFGASAEKSTSLKSHRMVVLLPGAVVSIVQDLRLESRGYSTSDDTNVSHDVRTDAAYPVRTTLAQQSLLPSSPPHPQGDGRKPQVGLTSNKGQPSGPLSQGTHSYDASDLEWISHDGAVFVPLVVSGDAGTSTGHGDHEMQGHFPSGSVITVENDVRSGDWQRSSTSQPDTPVKRDIFQATIDHGNVSPPSSSSSTANSTSYTNGMLGIEIAPAFAWTQLLANASAEDASDLAAAAAADILPLSLYNGTLTAVGVHMPVLAGTAPVGGALALTTWPGAPTTFHGVSPPVGTSCPFQAVTGASRAGVFLLRWNSTDARNGGVAGSRSLSITAADPEQGGGAITLTLQGISTGTSSKVHTTAASSAPLQLVGGLPLSMYTPDELKLLGVGTASAPGVQCSSSGGVVSVTATLPSGNGFSGASVTGMCEV